jgi:hypothetical protein
MNMPMWVPPQGNCPKTSWRNRFNQINIIGPLGSKYYFIVIPLNKTEKMMYNN